MADNPRGKRDWIEFFCEFETRTYKDISLLDYCQQRGIPIKTARNWASKLRADDMYPKNGVHPVGGKRVPILRKNSAHAARSGVIPAVPNIPNIPDIPAGQTAPNTSALPGNSGFDGDCIPIPENQGIKITGRVSYTQFLPPDIRERLDMDLNGLRDVSEEIKLTKGRMIMLQQARAAWEAKVEYNELTDHDYPIDEIYEEPDGTKVRRKRPDFEGQEDKLARRLCSLLQIQEQLSKRPAYSAKEMLSLRRRIIEHGENAGWTYTKIGLEIEKHGLDMPFTLQALIRKELDAPVIDNSDTGISDAELEELSRQYAEETAADDEWLSARKAQVQEIHSAHDAKKVAN